MKKLLADLIWSLIKDRVIVLIQEQQQTEKPRNFSKYAGGNRT